MNKCLYIKYYKQSSVIGYDGKVPYDRLLFQPLLRALTNRRQQTSNAGIAAIDGIDTAGKRNNSTRPSLPRLTRPGSTGGQWSAAPGPCRGSTDGKAPMLHGKVRMRMCSTLLMHCKGPLSRSNARMTYGAGAMFCNMGFMTWCIAAVLYGMDALQMSMAALLFDMGALLNSKDPMLRNIVNVLRSMAAGSWSAWSTGPLAWMLIQQDRARARNLCACSTGNRGPPLGNPRARGPPGAPRPTTARCRPVPLDTHRHQRVQAPRTKGFFKKNALI